ncbi:hypothetical protein AB0L57_09195 [Nocardia sp. NPDC052254]|uniref:hypothetical protein n=1 Tax=Nocardia sp. NPDC052254 TaxID=3155681 RepID=UPI00344A5B38
MRKQIVAGLGATFVVLGVSAAVVVVWFTASGPDPADTQPACCRPAGTTTVPEDGAGLRRNTSPSPAPTTETAAPRITLPHIPWPNHDPGATGG